MRKIIHIDMDAFYASVEQRDFPELRGKPIAVGGGEKRGVTTTASYEARAYGVRAAMPGWKAKELCPHVIFVPIRFEVYKEVSRQIRNIFERYTDLIEPLSLDEAFLDVTQNKIDEPIATNIALKIKEEIFNETQLTATAGVSYCKFLAKIASGMNKPNGITVIKPHQALSFIENLPVQKFFGVGKVTSSKMESLGIFTGGDLKNWSLQELTLKFGKAGAFYYNIVRGIDDRPVKPNRIRKSYAFERTLDENINDIEAIHDYVEVLVMKIFNGTSKINMRGKTITLKLKNKDFVIRTRSFTSMEYITSLDELLTIAHKLVNNNKELCQHIRLIGLTISNFEHEEVPKKLNKGGQLELGFE